MMLTPGGAVLVGAIAAVLSICGFRFGHDGDDGDNGNYEKVMIMITMNCKYSYVQPLIPVIKVSNYQG